MHKYTMIMMAALLCAAVLADPVIRPLTMQEMGRYAATDVLLIRASDLTESADNTAQTNTVTLSGPCAYEYVGYAVDTPFDSTLTTNTLSSTLTVKIGSDTLIDALQIANDTWRPYKVSWGGPPTVATTTTGTGTVYSNVIYNAGATTGNVTVATAYASVSAFSSPYRGVVTNGGTATITTIVTGPDASTSLAEVDSGQFRMFLRILR